MNVPMKVMLLHQNHTLSKKKSARWMSKAREGLSLYHLSKPQRFVQAQCLASVQRRAVCMQTPKS